MADEKADKCESNASEAAAIGSAFSAVTCTMSAISDSWAHPTRSIRPASGLVLVGNPEMWPGPDTLTIDRQLFPNPVMEE
jgi:hypothetical protein